MKKRIITLVSALCLVISSYAVTYKEDKTICEGTSFPTFTASAGDSHQWYRNNVIINGATNQSYTPTEAGEYKCVVGTSGSPVSTGNLLTYGGFNVDRNQWKGSRFSDSKYDPLTGRTLNIQYEFDNFDQNGVCDPGNYTTATNAKLVKPNYFQYIKPYEGTHLLVVDGRTNSSEFTFFFVRELQLKQGVTYEFSCQVANIDSLYFAKNHGTNSLPNLRFQIKTQDTNGQWVPLRPENSTNEGYLRVSENLGVWEEFKATYTAASNTWAEIRIQNTTNMNVVDGNDFAIDAIYFGANRTTEGSEEEEYFKVTVDKKYNAVLNDESLCPGTNTQVSVGFVTDNNMAMMPPANAQYTWLWSDPNTGPQTASSESLTVTPNSTPGQTKTYNVEVTYSEACNKATASMVVTTRTDCGNTTENTYTYQVCNNSPYTLFAIHPSGNPTWDNGETGDTRILSSVPSNTTTTYTCTIVDGADTYIEYHKVTGGDCNSTHNKEACIGQTITLEPSDALAPGNYCIWTLPDGSTQRSNSLDVTPTAEGTLPYTCIVYIEAPTGGNLPDVIIAEETFNVTATDCHSTTEHPEVTLCLGQEATLTPTFVADDYEWTLPDGTTLRAPSITVSYDEATTKEFKCTAIKRANTEGAPILLYNMMPNGDFEDTQSANNQYNGFTSSYKFYDLDQDFPDRSGADNDKNGYYRIASESDAQTVTPDPTGGNYFLECDGDDYAQDVVSIAYAAKLNGAIEQGKEYQFAFLAVATSSTNNANITFRIALTDQNGQVSYEPLSSNNLINNSTWQQFGVGEYWTASANYASAEIQLINLTKGWGGNDFALDNIMFQEVCRNANTEEIILHEETFTYTWGDCTTDEEWEVEYLKGTETTILTHKTGDSYKWFDQDGNELLDENGQPITSRSLAVVVDKTQKYTCEIDLGGGAKHYEYITINFYLPTSLSRCENQTAVLTPSKQGTYAWYLLNEDGSKKPISEPIIKNKVVYCEYLTPNATNHILCTITHSEGTRDEQWNITVHANPSFDVEVEGRDVTIKTDDAFTTLVLDEQTTYEQTWITMLSVGEHTLTMTNDYGCQSTRTFEVVPVPLEPMVFFSPNQDGNFDNWEVKGIEFYLEATIQIYDRYHRLLATIQGEELIKGWDGNYNGHAMPMDDYWYIIMIPETKQQISGHFVLKR
ncbi:MAG: T9SS type B sorting domain-containing protein [Paludibacteraceae bacterium]|nr:T9SS type B sorting domain-containing protein [Paludibacteraceae bacterium]